MAYKGMDRRRGPDLVVKTFHRLSIAVLVTNFMIIVVVGMAKPRLDTMFDKFAGSTVTSSWDRSMLEVASVLLILQFLIAAIGLVMNITRHHRKRDHYSASLIFSLVVAALGFVMLNF